MRVVRVSVQVSKGLKVCAHVHASFGETALRLRAAAAVRVELTQAKAAPAAPDEAHAASCCNSSTRLTKLVA